MSQSYEYQPQNVLEAAKERIRYTLRHFDNLVISFSGGKDSLTVVNLVKEVYQEEGRTDKVNVFFFDEEFVPTATLEFVNKVRNDPQINFLYACLQMESEIAYCGKIETIVQWDKRRTKYMRPIPEYAVTDFDNVYDVYTITNFLATKFKGKIANLTGIRAQESPNRRSMILSHKNDYPFIHKGKSDNISTVTPIYDWQLQDIWKYLLTNNIEYNINYLQQMYAGKKNLRVDTPLHAKGQKDFHLLKSIDPLFFAGLCGLFPELHAAATYNKDFLNTDNIEAAMSKYPHTWTGIVMYINDNIKDEQQKKQALFQVRQARRNRINQS